MNQKLTYVVEVGKDTVERYGHALASHLWMGAVAVVVVGAATLAACRARDRPGPRWLAPGFLLVVSVAALFWAVSLAWVCDDAFITFRYARHWVDGHGPVWNPGEVPRVEGYTNFLWMALVAAGMSLGAHPAHVALALSLAAFVVTISLADRLVRRIDEQPRFSWLAPVLIAASYTLASFATSGLETMLGAALVLLAADCVERGRLVQAGLASTLATMAHPDHGLFLAVLASLLLVRERRLPPVLRFCAPFAALFLPYFLLRWWYYADPLPNTFYAKSGGGAYASQGIVYVWVSAFSAGLPVLAPLVGVGLWRHRRSVTMQLLAVAGAVYGGYVVKVGGDFMLGRLLCPLLPLVLVAADLGLRALIRDGRRALAVGGAAFAALALVPTAIPRPGEKYNHIADERTFAYGVTSWVPFADESGYERHGKVLGQVFAGLSPPPKVALQSVGMLAYHSRLPVLDLYGLNDRAIAHRPIAVRGRPGHEKMGSAADLFDGDVDFAQIPAYPPPFSDRTGFVLDGERYFVVRLTPPLAVALGRAHVELDSPERMLDDLVADLPGRLAPSPAEAACEGWFWDHYYFGVRPQARERAAAFAAWLGAHDPSAGEAAPRALGPGYDALSTTHTRVRTFEFASRDAAWSAEGDAFEAWPSHREGPAQQPVGGRVGRFLSSWHRTDRDGATGRLRSKPFMVEGDVMTLLVGGGRDLDRLAVRLVVDGKPVRAATGCFAEVLGRRAWSLRGLEGKQAQLEVLDESDGGWGHVMVDEIVEWRMKR